jgi:hypothetical protein
MPQPTAFKLYWEIWNGYANPDRFWAGPDLVWILASTDKARRCLVRRSQDKNMQMAWNVNWKEIPDSSIAELCAMLEEADAYGSPKQLAISTEEGDYLTVWDLTGVMQSRPFHLSIRFTSPGQQLSDLGRRLNAALSRLKNME